jgi:two-component system response regulator CpxR
MPQAAPEVLLLTDDAELGRLVDGCGVRGLRVEPECDVRGGVNLALEGRPGLVMLDAALLDGRVLDVLRTIRSRSAVPLVMIARHVSRADRIAGLDAGADECWEKPLDPDEVVARVRAIFRRSGLPPVTPGERLVVNDVVLEPATRRASVGGDPLTLTSLEYDVLEYLVRAAGRIVSRNELMAATVQREASPFDRALDVHISRLRRKLGRHRALIHTVRGTGYGFSFQR